MDFTILFALIITVINLIVTLKTSSFNIAKVVSMIYFFFALVPNIASLFSFLTSDVNKSKTILCNLLRFITMGFFDRIAGILTVKGYGIYCNQSSHLETRHEGGEMIFLNSSTKFRSSRVYEDILNHDYKTLNQLHFELNDSDYIDLISSYFNQLNSFYERYRGSLNKLLFYKVLITIFNGMDFEEDTLKKICKNCSIDEIYGDGDLRKLYYLNNRTSDFESEISLLRDTKNKASICLLNKDSFCLRLGETRGIDWYIDSPPVLNKMGLYTFVNQRAVNFSFYENIKIGIIDLKIKNEVSEIYFNGRSRDILNTDFTMNQFLMFVFLMNWWSQNPNKGITEFVSDNERRGSVICHVYSMRNIVKKLKESYGINKTTYKKRTYINEGFRRKLDDEFYIDLITSQLSKLYDDDFKSKLLELKSHYFKDNGQGYMAIFGLINDKSCWTVRNKLKKYSENVPNWAFKRFSVDMNHALITYDGAGLKGIDESINVSKFARKLFPETGVEKQDKLSHKINWGDLIKNYANKDVAPEMSEIIKSSSTFRRLLDKKARSSDKKDIESKISTTEKDIKKELKMGPTKMKIEIKDKIIPKIITKSRELGYRVDKLCGSETDKVIGPSRYKIEEEKKIKSYKDTLLEKKIGRNELIKSIKIVLESILSKSIKVDGGKESSVKGYKSRGKTKGKKKEKVGEDGYLNKMQHGLKRAKDIWRIYNRGHRDKIILEKGIVEIGKLKKGKNEVDKEGWIEGKNRPKKLKSVLIKDCINTINGYEILSKFTDDTPYVDVIENLRGKLKLEIEKESEKEMEEARKIKEKNEELKRIKAKKAREEKMEEEERNRKEKTEKEERKRDLFKAEINMMIIEEDMEKRLDLINEEMGKDEIEREITSETTSTQTEFDKLLFNGKIIFKNREIADDEIIFDCKKKCLVNSKGVEMKTKNVRKYLYHKGKNIYKMPPKVVENIDTLILSKGKNKNREMETKIEDELIELSYKNLMRKKEKFKLGEKEEGRENSFFRILL